MKIHLIQGQYSGKDALDIITKMISIKIKFHESKIESSQNEEDIKVRETRIIVLQEELYESRKFIESKGDTVSVESVIKLSA